MTTVQLRNQIAEYFNKGELRNLCFDLDIDYENLPGETLDDKARELIAYCYRHGQLQSLVQRCRQLRSFVSWADIQEVTDLPRRSLDNFTNLQKIFVSIEQGDVSSFNADVLALKFANDLFGADRAVADSLGKTRNEIMNSLPRIGDYLLIPSFGRIKTKEVMFLNVGDLYSFDYGRIREFASKTLEKLAGTVSSSVKHVAMTIHGVGYGLDESEALIAQLAGYLDAFEDGMYPAKLEKITIVERDEVRVERLRIVLNKAISENPIPVPRVQNSTARPQQLITRSLLTRAVGRESAHKPHALVIMAGSDNNEDIYYYGIQEPVKAFGYLCERANLSSDADDAFEKVKARIETASLVIAELTEKNAGVFLTLGYAWGSGRPTILLMSDNVVNLPFNIHERCLVYRRIRDLEHALSEELQLLTR
jgi:hypothetical protein